MQIYTKHSTHKEQKFCFKIESAQKEDYETKYWLELLFETNCMNEENCKPFKTIAVQSEEGELFVNVIEHYDTLIDENNDPVYDPASLQEYMNKWDGQVFVDAMKLDKHKTVLEIGIGTGRLALKTIPLCKQFYGIDLSQKTIERATHNL